MTRKCGLLTRLCHHRAGTTGKECVFLTLYKGTVQALPPDLKLSHKALRLLLQTSLLYHTAPSHKSSWQNMEVQGEGRLDCTHSYFKTQFLLSVTPAPSGWGEWAQTSLSPEA